MAAAWPGFALVPVMALTLGEGHPVLLLVGAMALATAVTYAARGRGARTAES